MASYQTALDSINLRYGAPSRQIYGKTTLPRVSGQKTNEYQYQKLKNKINYGYNFDSLLNQGSVNREGW